jgi:hypothetical protein
MVFIVFDVPSEVVYQIIYWVKKTPYGGILMVGKHARNFIGNIFTTWSYIKEQN